jgi:hypothetical protein
MYRINFRNSRTNHEANAMLSSSILRCCFFRCQQAPQQHSTSCHQQHCTTYVHTCTVHDPTRQPSPKPSDTHPHAARDNHKIYMPPPPPYLPKYPPHICSRGRERRTDYTCLALVAQMFENFRVMPKGALRPTKFGSCGRGNAGSSRKRKAHTGK